MAIIEVEHLTKVYRAHPGNRVLFGRGGLGTLLSRHYTPDTSVALTDLTTSIELGECVGLVGESGSGKTTLLKLLAGISTPTNGKVTVLGRAVALLDADSGFEPALSGRENVLLQARLLGLTRKEADVILEAVCELAHIGDEIEQPLAGYSSGKRLLLAFAIAVHSSPDVLLIDNVFGSMDARFRKTCAAALRTLLEQGKTIVMVADSAATEFEPLCTRLITLDHGQIVEPGADDTIVETETAPISKTIHDGALSATFEHGRLHVSVGDQTLTSSEGFQADVTVEGSVRRGIEATWTLVESSDTHLLVLGRLPDTPASLEWRVDVSGERLVWNVALFCEAAVPPDLVEGLLTFAAFYDVWKVNDEDRTFPSPSGAEETVAGDGGRTIQLRVVSGNTAIRSINLDATSAMIGASMRIGTADTPEAWRVLRFAWTPSEEDAVLGTGRHEVLQVDLSTFRMASAPELVRSEAPESSAAEAGGLELEADDS